MDQEPGFSEKDTMKPCDFSQIVTDKIRSHFFLEPKNPAYTRDFLQLVSKRNDQCDDQIFFGYKGAVSNTKSPNVSRGVSNGVNHSVIDAIQKHAWICPMEIKFTLPNVKSLVVVAFLERTRGDVIPVYYERLGVGDKCIRVGTRSLSAEIAKIPGFNLTNVDSISHEFEEIETKRMESGLMTQFKIKDSKVGSAFICI